MLKVRYEPVPDSRTWRVWIVDAAQDWLAGEVYRGAGGFSARPRSWTYDRTVRGFPRKRDAASFCAIAAGFAKKSPPRRTDSGNCGAGRGTQSPACACPTSQEIKPDVRISAV